MKGSLYKILIALIIIYAGYLIYQKAAKPDNSSKTSQQKAVVKRNARTADKSDADQLFLHLNSPSDQSLLSESSRNLFSYYQKPVIKEPVKPIIENIKPVVKPPKELPEIKEARQNVNTPDPKLNNFSFVAYFATPGGTMVVLKEGQDEYAGSVGGVLKNDIKILNVKNTGTGQDFVEINVVNSSRPAKKIYFNPINF